MQIKTTTLVVPEEPTEDPRITQALAQPVGSSLLLTANDAGRITFTAVRTGTEGWLVAGLAPYQSRKAMVNHLVNQLDQNAAIVTVEIDEEFEL